MSDFCFHTGLSEAQQALMGYNDSEALCGHTRYFLY